MQLVSPMMAIRRRAFTLGPGLALDALERAKDLEG
jgi:hypothetical protein